MSDIFDVVRAENLRGPSGNTLAHSSRLRERDEHYRRPGDGSWYERQGPGFVCLAGDTEGGICGDTRPVGGTTADYRAATCPACHEVRRLRARRARVEAWRQAQASWNRDLTADEVLP